MEPDGRVRQAWAPRATGTPFHAGATAVSTQVMSQPAFDAVVSAHHGEITRYLRRVVGPSGEAEDLSQETFLRAYRAYPALPAEANVRAWLFAIATNLARNHFRAESRRRQAYGALRDAARHAADPPPEAALLTRETGALLDQAVARLPLKQRLAFIQRKLHGMDYATIGQSLHCSAESARAHVYQALRRLRQALDGHGRLPEEATP